MIRYRDDDQKRPASGISNGPRKYALARNDLILSRRIRDRDRVHLAGVDRREGILRQLARRNQRATDPLDEQVRAAFLDDDTLLDQLGLRADHVIRSAVRR